jgi:leucyl/phenylalanyl-tRNA--protein transferase
MGNSYRSVLVEKILFYQRRLNPVHKFYLCTMVVLNDKLIFPPVETATPEGIIAIGGDLSMERLLLAYRNGIFPWYSEGEPIVWWSPDPRFVLFPEKIRVTKSMQSVLNNGSFRFTINRAFTKVLQNCKTIHRKEQEGTWITPAIEHAYTQLHEQGYAHSAEAWQNGELVGGLYGIRIGNVFFGESMFSKQSNASKFAFIHYVRQLQKENVMLIDCQVYTAHLESLGAGMISRNKFMGLLAGNL